jgi:hypothetical protein
MFFFIGLILFLEKNQFIFEIIFFRKKEANISETYETIRHLLSRDEVYLIKEIKLRFFFLLNLKDYLLPFYISRSWINRYFYFAEPGPITNNDFLCKHGGLRFIFKKIFFFSKI